MTKACLFHEIQALLCFHVWHLVVSADGLATIRAVDFDRHFPSSMNHSFMAT